MSTQSKLSLSKLTLCTMNNEGGTAESSGCEAAVIEISIIRQAHQREGQETASYLLNVNKEKKNVPLTLESNLNTNDEDTTKCAVFLKCNNQISKVNTAARGVTGKHVL